VPKDDPHQTTQNGFYRLGIKQPQNQRQSQHRIKLPDLTLLRPALFWDTDLQKIDWKRQKRAVIKRVWERGNEQEKAEMKRLYGEQEIVSVLYQKLSKR
jgi:antitoxin HigA-1